MQTRQMLERIYHDLSAGRISRQEAFAQIQALKRQPAATATETLTAVPVWCASTPDNPGAAAWSARQVIVLELPGVAPQALEELLPGSRCVVLGRPAEGNLAQRYTEYAVACFERIKALLAARPAGAVLLQVVAGDDAEHAVFGGLAALLKTARLENPDFCGQLILSRRDISSAALAQQLDQAQMHAAQSVIRYERDTQPLALQWQEQAALPAEPVFKEHGVYLITGGLGGLGVVFAQAILGQTRHARVILTGRQALAGEKQQRFDALQAQADGRVHYRVLDLNDAAQVGTQLAELVREHGGLHGIVHAAGMIADNYILKKTAAEFRQVLAPKVSGTLHLDQASAALALDFFALFSSVASAFGNAGQADYAAANGFLDEFAQWRNARAAAGERRGRTLAIHWPLWQEGGMRLDAALLAEVERSSGMQPLSTVAGLLAFHRCAARGHARSLVLEGDPAVLQRTLHGSAAVPPALRAACAETLSRPELLERTQDWLRKQFSVLLKLSPQRIDPQAPLEQYGIDSILAMRLTAQLEQGLGALSKTLLFEYRSIADLAAYFAQSHAAELQALLLPVRSAAAAPAAASGTATDERAPNRSRLPPPRRGAESAAVNASAEPIAIVGLSGRYPESPDLAAYWNNLREGRDCIVEVPAERWDWRDYYSADRSESGRHYSRWGGFIEGVAEFDPQFFNIAPREARQMDPQERLFLQHAWLAVEDAGYTRATLQGRPGDTAELGGQVGVYVGMMYSEYPLFAAEASQRGQRLGLTGSFASIANRVSYALDLHGPSMTLDTMCSSSLTAIHLACQDLRLGRTRLAIAGGVNVTIHPNKYLALSAGQFISSDGHCQSFGEGGDGYIPGEGVGVVVLKRLSEAQRDGDHIYGVIRASALNHGGRTNGYTVPNPQAQAAAVALALREARVDARHISYIEAHGTGTKLGDPIEIAALNKAFGQYTQDKQYCLIGSAKSNIGHCESAAGIAGLTKVLLQMRHRQIVPSLHSARLNPHIDFAATPFTVNQNLTDWEAPLVQGRRLPRIAGISSFGAGGSNAHLIVEEYTAAPASPVLALSEPVIVVLSARTPEQLQRKAQDLVAFISAAAAPPDLGAVAYTLQTGREPMEERLGLVVSSIEELSATLQAWLAGDESADVQRGQVRRHKETLALFSSDADLQQAVERWLTGRKFDKLVELWVKGLDVRWAKLYGATLPQRVSLPGYPFARERYWLDIGGAAPAAVAPQAAARREVLHPLLQENISDLYQQGYRSRFSGEEAFCTAQGSLGAGAYLEMARAALALAGQWPGALELRNTLWAPPPRLTADTPVCVAVQAQTARELVFEIYSASGAEEILHCQGQALLLDEAAAPRIGLTALQPRAAAGGEVLLQLRAVAGSPPDAQHYVLHPLLLEQTLQAAAALLPATAAWQPATLDTLRVLHVCPAQPWAWIRRAADSTAAAPKLDIDLCDDSGNVCAQLHGLVHEAAVQPQAAAITPQWSARDGIAVTAQGEGIYVLRIAAAAGRLDAASAATLAGAIAALRTQDSLRVLLLVDETGAFLRGGAAEYNALLQAQLPAAISEFPYPVIGALGGDASGAGWWLAACCDLLVCSETGRYGLADAALYADAAQQAFLAARFAAPQARQLQTPALYSGAQLIAQGWGIPVLPAADVEKHALALAVRLAAKPAEALRLLKAHLARELQPLAAALQPLAPRGAVSPQRRGEARLIDIDRVEPSAVLAQLEQAVAAIVAGGESCAVVLASASSAFVADARADDVLALQAAIAAAPVPVIAALGADAQGSGWWLGLGCDACVLSESGRYEAAQICAQPALAARAALDFPHSLGEVLGREVLLGGGAYTGLALKQRAAFLQVVPAPAVLAAAQQLAQDLGAQAAADFTAAKRSRTAAAQRAAAALPAWPAPAESANVSAAGIVALDSSVVTATARADGVLLVELHDRDARNLFSEALVSGVSDVFAHVAANPYKAVVLTGYDSYFASGGTRDSLLAIQAGTAKFTDLQLFQCALQCDIPVIAALQGHAIGAGWSLGLFADLAIFAEESHYLSPYMNYGFTPGAGATLSVPQRFGLDLARESLFSAHEYTGRELAARGIAQRVLPRSAVVAAALELAGRIARQPRAQLLALKQQWAAPLRAAIAPLLQRELAMHEATFVGRADTRALIENRYAAASVAAAPAAAAVAADDPDALPAMRETLRSLLAQELQLGAGEIEDDAQFIDLGLDSIVGVTWIRRINERYGLDIEATKVYSHPTLAQLSRHVRDEAARRGLLAPRPAVAAAATETAAPVPLPAAAANRRLRRSAARGLRALAASGSAPATAPAYSVEPIAVVGMAGQFPQATTLARFWRNIAEGRDCISAVPPQRWDMDRYYRSGAAAPGQTNSRWMGLLEEFDLFDPLFFNISPKEAEYMDPQQRLFLQTCWQAIEDAGYTTRSLSGTRCGVFAGCASGDYQQLAPEQRLTAQGFTGNASSILAARISYFFNLQGPCVAIDTACSSSLVAIAQACDSLLSGASEVALAGGVYVASGPDMHIKTAQAGMLSTDGRCFTFDQRANGFVPGEGVGVVVLKRLSDAQRDNDPIYGVIQGWGVNQDGKTNGITAPNPQSQTRLQQEVYDRFGIDPGSIQLIEAHGTGTKLGDPIEVEALKASFGKYTQKQGYCALGSVKSNIGHCLTAAGIAGFIKLMLALKHRQQPPTIQFEQLNEHIDLNHSPFYINQQLRDWDVAADERRQAAISSFGFSGTNAHIVVAEQATAAAATHAAEPAIVVLSARTAEQLQQKVRDLLAFIAEAETAPDLAALAYTLQVGREAMDERLGLIVSSLPELVEKLRAWADGTSGIAGLQVGQARRHRETLALLSADPELQQTVDRWLSSRRYAKVMELWVKGFDWDWRKLHATPPRRISLPTYPFARERYWSAVPAPAGVTTAALHPLLHANASDLYQQCYHSTFSGEEAFCRDGALPALACLEMARAALGLALRAADTAALELRDIAWTSNLPITTAAPLQVLLDALNGNEVACEICTTEGEDEILLWQGNGRLAAATEPAPLALAALRGRLPQENENTWRSRDELLQVLEMPAALRERDAACVLHPQLLENLLQTAQRWLGAEFAPLTLDRLQVSGSLPATGWAWLRRAPQRAVEAGQCALDIDLCDTEGRSAAQLHGLVLEPVAVQAVDAAAAASASASASEQMVAQQTAAAVPVHTQTAEATAPTRMPPLRIALAAAAVSAPVDAAAEPLPLPERDKPRGITLVNPRAIVAAELLRHQVARERPRIALANARVVAAAATGAIEVLDQGGGVFTLRLDAGLNRLDKALIQALLRALETLRAQASLRVLLLCGSDESFLRGGNDAYDAAIRAGLHQAIATFPYPVVALMQGAATGAGWWLGSLCDLQLCSEEAQYGYAPADRAMLAAQAGYLRERFGSVLAQQLQSPAGYCSGAQLKASGAGCAVLPREQVYKQALALAAELAGKSAAALRLLKAHLARPLAQAVAALTPVAPDSAGRWTGSEAARVIRLDQRDLATVTQQFADAVAQISAGTAYRSIVLASDVAPFDGSEAPEQLLALLAAIDAAEVPVIAALGGDAQGLAWLLALSCDACVLAAGGWYGGTDFAASAPLYARAAWQLPESLGLVLGRELLLTGEQYSGAQLVQRLPALDVRPAEDVQAAALALAQGWSAAAPQAVIAARRARVARMTQALAARPAWPVAGADMAAPPQGRIALATTVVSATAQANGVLLIQMHDRDAKNMFSEALVAGINEAFAHAASQPYRAVVLSGYDNYFASGGTKESLLAIQAGTAKFTDFKIFQLAQQCEVPVIAAMQGHGVGAGWSLGMFADVVLFGEGSHYVSPYMSYGFTPGAGSTLMVPQQLGHDLARESLLTAHEYTGRELRERGIAQAVLPREQVLEAALALAQRIARTPRPRLVNFKQQWTAALRERIEDTYQRELAMHDETFVGKAETSGHIHARFEQLERSSTPVPAASPAAAPQRRGAVAAAAAPAATLTLAAIRIRLKESLDAELHMQGRPIDDEEQFIHLGVDSINGVTWMRRINTDFGTAFEATTIYSYPTIRELATFLHAQLKPAAAVAPEGVPEPEPLPPPQAVAVAAARRTAPRRSARQQWRQRPSSARDTADTRIAIVGMSGRYPQADNLDQFWDNLVRGRNSIVEVPASRWNADAFYDRDPKKKDRMTSRWVGAMDDIDCFDPLFFRISPEEAQYMDPQHRLFLQESYRAFEDAGYSTQTLSNRHCGVYLGISMNEYALLLAQHGVMAAPVTGNSYSIAAARIAYYLNLKGPAISVDTACSSSLVALHLACQALRSGEVDMALAGGVSLWLLPESYLSMSQAGMLSPTGQCKAFDDSADGIVMGDGVGALVLKRLRDAVADNDVIHGVIIGSGTNQDGRTNGITAPSVVSQIELERGVYQRYGIDPASISYVEAHGTGTRLGDPIELQALATVFKEYTDRKHYCALASVKSNIGHASSAAGVAGVQKVLLSLRHRTLAPTLHVSRENSHFDFASSPFYVNRSAKSWDSPAGAPRRACINSFGYSGTNAHVVIEEYVAPAAVRRSTAPQALPLSARTPEQLRQKVQQLCEALQRAPETDLAAVAYTLQTGREPMEQRLGIVAATLPQLLDTLRRWLDAQAGGDATLNGEVATGEVLGNDDSEATLRSVEQALQRGDAAAVLRAWCAGAEIAWERLHAGTRPARTRLPSYPFARERYWVEDNKSTDAGAAAAQQPGELAWIEDILAKVDSDTLQQDQAVALLRQWV